MERAFLDANVLFSASRDPQSRLLRIWSVPSVEVLTSAYAVAEVRRNLEGEEHGKRLESLIARTRLVAEPSPPSIPEGVVLRDKDTPILAAALASGATYLVTGDSRDFGRYFGKAIGSLRVLPPSDFLAIHDA